MGQTCTRDASFAFDHLCHQMNVKRNKETRNQLDDQLQTTDPAEIFTKIKRLADDEVKFYSAVLTIYGQAHSQGGFVNQADLTAQGKEFFTNLQQILYFSDGLPASDKSELTSNLVHRSELELDGIGLNMAWSLALAQLTQECCSQASTLAGAVNVYQAKNSATTAFYRETQAKALNLLPWKPYPGSVSIWLRDSPIGGP